MLQMRPETVALRLGYDHDRAAAAVAAFADRMTLNAIDASVVSGTSGFVVTGSIDGHRLDVAAAVDALDHAMRDPATRAGAVVQAPVARIAPALTSEAATQATVAANRVAGFLTVSAGGKTWRITAKEIRPWIGFAWVDGEFRPVIDRANIPAALKKIAKAVSRPVLDAEFLRDKRGHIVGSKADRAGRKLDMTSCTKAVANALEARVD